MGAPGHAGAFGVIGPIRLLDAIEGAIAFMLTGIAFMLLKLFDEPCNGPQLPCGGPIQPEEQKEGLEACGGGGIMLLCKLLIPIGPIGGPLDPIGEPLINLCL